MCAQWGPLAETIVVVQNFRDLGAHSNISGRPCAVTLNDRHRNSATHVKTKGVRVRAQRNDRIELGRCKYLNMSAYGSDVIQPSDCVMAARCIEPSGFLTILIGDMATEFLVW